MNHSRASRLSWIVALFLLAGPGPLIVQPLTAGDRFQEIEAARQLIRGRLREPHLLEAQSFRLLLDREDPTFRLEDVSSSVNWTGPLDRRGFATVLLPTAGGVRELPVDRMLDPVVTARRIEFRAGSSLGELPDLRIHLQLTSPLVGLEIGYEFRGEAPAGARVRILDRGLWTSDLDDGACLWPGGRGEWHRAITPSPLTTRIRSPHGDLVSREIPASPVPGLVLRRLETGLVVQWSPVGVEVELGRRDHPGAPDPANSYPGERRLELSITGSDTRGAVRLYPLGRVRFHELTSSLRQLLEHPDPFPSLRRKSGIRAGLRGFVGAPVFRFTVGGGEGSPVSLLEVDRRSRLLAEKLGLSKVYLRLAGWHESTPDGWLVKKSLGGRAGLVDLDGRLAARGQLLGLELELETADLARSAPELGERLTEVVEDLQPDVLHLRGLADGSLASAETLRKRLEMWRGSVKGLGELGTLVSGPLFDLAQVREAASLEVDLPSLSRSAAPFPLLASLLGQQVRLLDPPARALEPGDWEGVLDFLIRGEAPLLAWSPGAGEEGIFTRGDGGWYEGQEIPPFERFVKTISEVLTPLAELRHRNPIHTYETLDERGKVEEIYFGYDLRVVVNRGEQPFTDPERDFTLPRGGFWIQHPFFLAFHATRAFGVDYPRGALFTIRSLEGKLWLRAEKVRIWHGFGPSRIRLGGRDFTVEREVITRIW